MERKVRLINANELPVFTTIDKIIGTENGTEAIVTHWVQDDFITNAPTVEAIPMEWIIDWLSKYNSYGFDCSAVEKMLEDWEKEGKING